MINSTTIFARRLALCALAMLLALCALLIDVSPVSAAELTTRSIRVSTAQVGQVADHNYAFTVPSTAVIGSIAYEYCTNSPLEYIPCVAPAGLDVTAASITAQTGNTGFSVSVGDTTAYRLVITRPAAAGTTGATTFSFADIINPSTANQTTFIRIATFATTDATGAPGDMGAVAFSTATVFEVSAYVPPFLTFCVGVFVTLNCNSVTGFRVDVGELQTSLAATASMQFSGATNDPTGFTTYLNGFTMTSGNNIITALSSNAGSIPGTSQFGFNLRANTVPTGGLDPVGAGTSVAAAGYNTPNSFRFVNGEAITNSPVATDFRLFTATYIVNVSEAQPPGVYATTMTFTAIAAF